MKRLFKQVIIVALLGFFLVKANLIKPILNFYDDVLFFITEMYSSYRMPAFPNDPLLENRETFELGNKNYTVVKTYEEWEQAINSATASLTPSLSMKIRDYNDDLYNIKNISSDNVAIICQGKFVGGTAFLTYSFDYNSNAKILAAYENSNLKELLSEEELAALNEAYNVVERLVTPQMTDYEKELALHDYLVAECTYDEEAAKSSATMDDARKKTAHSIQGLLLNKKGVCEAYANTFLLLCKIAGLECHLANGDSLDQLEDNTKHQWNIVKLDDEYYNVDLTFDDPIPSVEGRVLYNYFNLSDSELSKTHVIDEKNIKCFGEKYNYFNYNNLNVSNKDQLLALVKDKLDKGIRKITFRTYDDYFVNNAKIFYPIMEEKGLTQVFIARGINTVGVYYVTFE